MSPYRTAARSRDGLWWNAPEKDAHDSIHEAIRRIEDNDRGRRRRLLRHARLYGNREIRDLTLTDFHRTPESDVQLKYNLVRSVVSAWVAKVGKMRPRPMFLTIEGDYSLSKKAQKMTRFLEGEFQRGDLYSLGPDVARDAALFDGGVLKVYEGPKREGEKHGLICYERVFPWELRVDPVEGFYGSPRSLYQVKAIDRHVLARAFGNKGKPNDDVLDEQKAPRAQYATTVESIADMVDVCEAWHLPSAPGAKDGRHVICVLGATLVDEPWTRDRFPFSVFRFDRPLAGYWGSGMVEDLLPIQYELNVCLEQKQAALHLLGNPRVYVERGSKVIKSHLTNEIGAIIEYTGTPPTQVAPPPYPKELDQHIMQLISWGFESTGVSRLGAQAQKPAGLNSGRALRTFEDIETERFAIQARAYELFFMDVAEQAVELVGEISERDGGYEVKAYDHRSVERLDWSDIKLAEDVYQLRVFPTSLLPTQPQAKLESVQELVESGFMQREDALRMLDFPDIEAFTSLEVAAYEIIDQAIERMIEEGEYISPEPFFPLEWGRGRVQQAYLKGKLNGVPDERLELLRTWMDDATSLLTPDAPTGGPADAAAMPEPSPPAGGGASPPLPPGAPPMPPGGMPPGALPS